MMKVFLSWSGSQSKALALQLHEWLPQVIQDLDPWFSEKDITAGSRWGEAVATQLAEGNFGIICLTPGNLNAPWIHFEAGALSKALKGSYVVPYLLGLDVSSLPPSGPLFQFQPRRADKEGTRALCNELNKKLAKPLSDTTLNLTFEKFWPDLERKLAELQSSPQPAPIKRSPEEILEDLLAMSRETDVRLQRIEGLLARLGFGTDLGDSAFTEAEVIEEFARIRYLSRGEVTASAPELRRRLNEVGIRSRLQLRQLVNSTAVLSWLEDLYRRELLRRPEAPLDPSAVATWGGMLFANGLSEQIKQHITTLILNSDEYRRNHPPAKPL